MSVSAESMCARAAAERSLSLIAGSYREEVWISRFAPEDVLAQADRIDTALALGADLPLAGLTFAVKDNIDVAGLETTAGCAAYAYRPSCDAPSVRALSDVGAICIGKTNLDQFATGLVGTRSPYGAVRNAIDPTRISGGSSSGSAVAVALGMVDMALATDTAGSGRMPAALNGIVGIKGTYGLVSTSGMVPACRSFDCVSVFARDVATAERAMAALVGANGSSQGQRSFPPDSPLGLPLVPTVARVTSIALDGVSPSHQVAYAEALAHLEAMGCRMVEIDFEPYLEAGRLLYEGAFVAERYAAVGAWVTTHPHEVDSTVLEIILGAADISAERMAADIGQLSKLQASIKAEWTRIGADSLVLPTAPSHPTIDDAIANPININRSLGKFVTFLNLLDMCAVAVPFGESEGLPFGISCIGPAFSDLVQADMARMFERPVVSQESTPPGPRSWRSTREARMKPPGVPLAVVGAHLGGQPLNHQLLDRGARLLGSARTANVYRLYALNTSPSKPGLLRVREGGEHIALEVWELPPSGFADFVADIPAPMAIGKIQLDDGQYVPGFLCEPIDLGSATEITEFGGWLAYLQATPPQV